LLIEKHYPRQYPPGTKKKGLQITPPSATVGDSLIGGDWLCEELELWSALRYCHAVGSVTMEDTMCWEIDYQFFAEQKKAQQTRIEQERRAGVIHQLLNEANKQGEPSNVEGAPAKETAPAK
jgi:hypothetical protein